MATEDEGIGLPQMSEDEMFSLLLSDDAERDDSEPAIAAGIGEQMLHMSLRPLPRSMRARIRDISSRIPAKNAVLIGGGIGHLSAWLLDLWCGDPANPPEVPPSKPDSFRIIEPGGKFGVIIDRLIRRHGAEVWTQVIQMPWSELAAEAATCLQPQRLYHKPLNPLLSLCPSISSSLMYPSRIDPLLLNLRLSYSLLGAYCSYRNQRFRQVT